MLKVNTEKLGSVAVLYLEGEIVNGNETTTLRKAVLAQLDSCAVVLDFAKVELIDAGGLGVLVELRQWTQSRGIEFRLMNVTRLVNYVLAITRLDTVFQMSSRAKVERAVARPRRPALAMPQFAPCAEV